MSNRQIRRLDWSTLPIIAAAIGVAALSWNAVVLFSQSPPSSRAAFEVASVKKSTAPPGIRIVRSLPGGRVTARAFTVQELVRAAYATNGVQMLNQVIVAAGWMTTDRFDVEAKAEKEFSAEPEEAARQRAEMLQSLLADRFKLSAHIESRELPEFRLVIANKEGKLGPQITPSTCTPRGKAPAAPADSNVHVCAPLKFGAGGGVVAEGMTMRELATALSGFPEIERPVRDQTRLTDAFDFHITWVGAVQLRPDLTAGAPNPNADSGPSIYTALQEQLGLRLDPDKAMANVVVVDRAEPPIEN